MQRLVASCLGLGFIPRRLWGRDAGAGTFGAFFGALVAALLLALGAVWWLTLSTAVVLSLLSVWSAQPFSDDHGDPAWVCMDEAAGTVLAVVGLGGVGWIVAVVVARLADIFKVLPGVAAAERLPGSIGVTADDLVAGLYGLAAGWLVTGAF